MAVGSFLLAVARLMAVMVAVTGGGEGGDNGSGIGSGGCYKQPCFVYTIKDLSDVGVGVVVGVGVYHK
jgi:hypothetical protein